MWRRPALGTLVGMQLLTRLRFADDPEPGFAGYNTGPSLPLARFGRVIANLRTDFLQRRLLEAERTELAATTPGSAPSGGLGRAVAPSGGRTAGLADPDRGGGRR